MLLLNIIVIGQTNNLLILYIWKLDTSHLKFELKHDCPALENSIVTLSSPLWTQIPSRSIAKTVSVASCSCMFAERGYSG